MYNYEPAIQKLPSQIEAANAAWGPKLQEALDIVNAAAASSGSERLMQDIAALTESIESSREVVQRDIIGKEDDTLTENGSAFAQLNYAKKMKAAMEV